MPERIAPSKLRKGIQRKPGGGATVRDETATSQTALIVAPQPDRLAPALEAAGYTVHVATTWLDGKTRMAERPYGLYALSLDLPDCDPLTPMRALRERDRDARLLVCTEDGGLMERSMDRLMRLAAGGFLVWPWDGATATEAIQHARNP